ncbi:MAG TPA: hypothetical protein PLY68_07435, partial [Myxococcota bacterium]|nr:hypothetical protein [Myxococcota bacterium]
IRVRDRIRVRVRRPARRAGRSFVGANDNSPTRHEAGANGAAEALGSRVIHNYRPFLRPARRAGRSFVGANDNSPTRHEAGAIGAAEALGQGLAGLTNPRNQSKRLLDANVYVAGTAYVRWW